MRKSVEVDLNGKRKLALSVMRNMHIPAMSGMAFMMKAGEFLRLTDPKGKQPADFWAFNAENLEECLSAEHTRVWINRLFPRAGESFHTCHRRPMLQLVADTCGIHDMLTAACDPDRYRLYGASSDHPSCADNLLKSMASLGHNITHVPSPVNFFTRVLVHSDGRVETCEPPSKAGDHIILKAWIDCYAVVSACPQEFNPVAGWFPTELLATTLAESASGKAPGSRPGRAAPRRSKR
jgi:uncharacterized protein